MRQDLRKPEYADAEWTTRVQLAACYRILHRLRMTDTINTHIAARITDGSGHFIINSYGLRFDEICASNLVKVDHRGRAMGSSAGDVNTAGFSIHSAVFGARSEIVCSLHTHTRAGVAVSALKCGLLPISQFAFYFHDRIGYSPYRHFGGSDDDCTGLAADLGSNFALILQNHGLLTVGRTIPEAFLLTYYLDKACDVQLAAQATGSELLIPDEREIKAMAEEVDTGFGGMAFGDREWDALVRDLDRVDPSYRN
jgi:ribulose-5-phosphate 4-epimerase/fuculose-1-phosphate aldolase